MMQTPNTLSQEEKKKPLLVPLTMVMRLDLHLLPSNLDVCRTVGQKFLNAKYNPSG